MPYKAVDSGYTLRQYFAHSTLEKGPGPGWDFRTRLLNDAWTLKHYGRTFTEDEVLGEGGQNLPDDIPYVEWVPVDES